MQMINLYVYVYAYAYQCSGALVNDVCVDVTIMN